MRTFVPVLLIALASGVVLHAAGANARGLAQPAVPALTGRVVDRADLLSPTVEATITSRLQAFEDSTTAQVAVLTVPSLKGENLEEWATTVFRTWGLGRADADNGVLILIARDDRKIRIEVGFGLEADLTDAEAGAIIRNEMTPRFREGDFEAGTLAAVDAVIGTVAGTYVPPEASGGEPDALGLTIMLFLFGLPGLLGFRGLVAGPVERYVGAVTISLFVGFLGAALFEEWLRVPFVLGILLGAAAYVALFGLVDILLSQTAWFREKRKHHAKKVEAFRRARKKGRTSVVVDGISYTVPTASSSSSGGSSFSGGGGSSGGGGASGGW